MYATVAAHAQRVLYVETVEPDGVFSDGRCKGVLQQAYLVVVNVDVGEEVFQRACQDVARLEELLYALRAFAFHDVFLCLGALAVYPPGHRLAHRDRQYQLVGHQARLNLVECARYLAKQAMLKVARHHLVGGKSELLVLAVLIVIAMTFFISSTAGLFFRL